MIPLLPGEMNSDDQRGAVRVIHNAIDLEEMGREKVSQLPVVSDGRLEGIISLDHILQILRAAANRNRERQSTDRHYKYSLAHQ